MRPALRTIPPCRGTALTNHLRLLRRTRGYRQKQLAVLVGCTADALSAYERGTALPPLKTALLLEITLGARLAEIYVSWYDRLGKLAVRRTAVLPPALGRHIRGRVLRKD